MTEPPRITRVDISNFRSLDSLSITLSPMTCLVGKNNSGKSSLMIALSIFRSGEKVLRTDYYDTSKPISISVCIGPFSSSDLQRLTTEAQSRISEILVDGHLHLVRKYSPTGDCSLLCKRMLPKNVDLDVENLKSALRGTTGIDVAKRAAETLPELQGVFDGCRTQAAAVAALDSYITNLPREEMSLREAPLVTGISNSISAILPEIIYVPAVQDISDALKTKEAASFGKLLRLFVDEIGSTPEFEQIKSSFRDLDRLLNRQIGEDGRVVDERIGALQNIEESVTSYLQEQFPAVTMSIDVPPPELKAVFGNAQIVIDDGMTSSANHKGDGIKRAIMFALIRTYVQKRQLRQPKADDDAVVPDRPFLFLFEEPELYLHPQAQHTLYSCLTSLARSHQVCVSTHSPCFLHPTATGTFARIKKVPAPHINCPPVARVAEICISESLDSRDAFQFLCYENNAAAFFADKVLLVEGDSEEIFLPKYFEVCGGRQIGEVGIAVVQAGGKGTVERMRKFFGLFEIDVHVLVDLDAILEGFDKLGASARVVTKRNELIKIIDQKVVEHGVEAKLTSKKIKKVVASDSWQKSWTRAREICQFARDRRLTDGELAELDLLWSKHESAVRYQALLEVEELKQPLLEVLADLRREKIYILSAGSIEDYYPAEVFGSDKPTKALNAASLLTDKSVTLKCGPSTNCDGTLRPELLLIAESILSS